MAVSLSDGERGRERASEFGGFFDIHVEAACIILPECIPAPIRVLAQLAGTCRLGAFSTRHERHLATRGLETLKTSQMSISIPQPRMVRAVGDLRAHARISLFPEVRPRSTNKLGRACTARGTSHPPLTPITDLFFI